MSFQCKKCKKQVENAYQCVKCDTVFCVRCGLSASAKKAAPICPSCKNTGNDESILALNSEIENK